MKVKMIIAAIAVCGWWGFLYPELTLLQDTCIQVEEKSEEVIEEEDKTKLYYQIMEADSKKIKIKSRLFEMAKKGLS